MRHDGFGKEIRKDGLRTRWELFWRRVKRGNSTECWPFTGKPTALGYGRYKTTYLGKKHLMFAHRLSFVYHYGYIPPVAMICHKCDNPICTNPGHLYIGTSKTNMEDRSKRFPNGTTPRAEASPKAKITRNEVYSIRFARDNRLASVKFLARAYGISDSQIYRIANRQLWRSV